VAPWKTNFPIEVEDSGSRVTAYDKAILSWREHGFRTPVRGKVTAVRDGFIFVVFMFPFGTYPPDHCRTG
jgi:hypothetical protein